MPTLPRVIDYVGRAFDEIRIRLGAKADTNEGARWDALSGVIGQGFVRANRLQIDGFDAHVLGLAKGQDLDQYVKTHGPLQRFPARSSFGYAAYLRSTAAFGATTIPMDKTFRVPFRGKSVVFRVVEDVQVGATQTSIPARIEAVVPGLGGNVATVSAGLGQIDALDDVTILPIGVVVAGGCEVESDDELTARQTAYEQGRERATRPAIAYGALLVNGVKHVVVSSRDDDRRGGQGMVYVGDVNWDSSKAMLNDVAVSLEDWRGLKSIGVRAIASEDVSINAVVSMARSLTAYNVSSLRAAIIARILEYFDKRLTPFEYSLASIQGRIERGDDEIVRTTLSAPAVSVSNPLTPSALALTGFPSFLTRYRTNAGLITLDIRGPE